MARSKSTSNKRRKCGFGCRLTAGSMCLFLFAGISACGLSNGLSKSSENLTERYQANVTEEVSAEVLPEFAESYTEFAIRLLAAGREDAGAEGKNTMVSPLSVMLALEMTRNGAVGDTKTEMESVLYAGIMPKQGKNGLLAFCQNLPDSKESRFHIANSIWFRNGENYFEPDETFLETNAREYDAEIYAAPFDEETCSDINHWVENETEGMIKDILDGIPENALLYLVNAVAFEAEWQEVYNKNQISSGSFFSADGSSSTVDMMHSNETKYLQDAYASGFIKPYADGYSFAALLPAEGLSLDDYLGQLEGAAFLKTIRSAEDIQVSAGLPKFEAETKLELQDILAGMGMPLAFDPLEADFSAMGSCEAANIFISRVIHKTYIDVNELGTRAGAATVAEMAGESAPMDIKIVNLDRPFLYAIIDTENGLPVFIGTVEHL